MSRFAYRAVGAEGQMIEGELRADSRERAIDILRSRAVVPVSVHPLDPWRTPFRGAGSHGARLAAFTRELEVLIGAGVPVARALDMLAGPAGPAATRGLARELLDRVRGGAPLAAAMAAHPQTFPAYYTGIVRAGEEGGTLPLVLDRLATMLERQTVLAARIRGTLAYPMLILGLSGLTMVLLLVYVIPEFRSVFQQSGVPLPLATRLVMTTSGFVVEWGWLLALLLLLGWLALRRWAQSAQGGRFRDRLLLRLPLVGRLTVLVDTARFCRTLGTLVVNGVALIEAVRIAGGTLANRELQAAAAGMAGTLARGDGLLLAIDRAGWFPERVRHLAAVGLESGQVGEMLLRVAAIHEAEAERAVERLAGLLAPVATILLGCLIAFMIGSILAAVLGSYDLAL